MEPKGFKTAAQAKFLACLSLGMSVSKACQAAGVPRSTVYYLRAESEAFMDAWDEAKANSVEELEDHLRKRATDVNDKSSHLLLMFLLKKLDPTYRENYKVETKRSVTAAKEFEFDPAEIDAAMSILQIAKARKHPTQED